jgi:PleD family two-component response regulator
VATILMVEPPSAMREALIGALTSASHRVFLAQTGQEALEQWRLERQALAILDARAPRLEGAEVAARMRALAGGYAPVLLIASGDLASKVAALEAADDVVARPYQPAEVVARVGALLRTRRLVEELKAARADSEARSLTDPATGLRNRLFLGERLNEEWRRAVRYGEPLAVLLMAVAAAGAASSAGGGGASRGGASSGGASSGGAVDGEDQLKHNRRLVTVAQQVLRALRQVDVVARFGPLELAIILPNTHFAGALTCADRLRKQATLSALGGMPVGICIGVALFPAKDVANPADLLKLAARALERARGEGPGNVCLVQHQGYLLQPP